MSAIVDNLIAYRFLSLIVKPFVETEAYKLGIIDENGNNLIKASKLKTKQQKDAYSYLHRLAFNLKKILAKLPGGDSRTKSFVAALYFIREASENKSTTINEEDFMKVLSELERNVVFVEEQLIVDDFLMLEEAPTNATGPAVTTNEPAIKRKRKFAKFIVNDEVFNKFAKGKAKYRRWSEYLNLEDEGQSAIYKFAKANPKGIIVLQNGQETKAIRFNPKGGGSWSKINRKGQQFVQTEVM